MKLPAIALCMALLPAATTHAQSNRVDLSGIESRQR